MSGGTTRRPRRPRRGAALAVALFALVGIAAIAHAMLQPAVAGRRAARRTAVQYGAESAVERALAEVVARPPSIWYALGAGAQPAVTSGAPLPGRAGVPVRLDVLVHRLTSSVFSVVVDGRVGALDVPVSVRRSVLLELVAPPPRDPAAVTAGGDVALAADTRIEPDAGCPREAGATADRLLVGESTAVRREGAAVVDGVTRDSAATTAGLYLRAAGIPVDALVAAADSRLPGGSLVSPRPVVEGGACAPGAANWGEAPGSGGPCASHAPVIVVEGNLVVEGGVGRGALIVDGRLEIRGPFQYEGLIVATGGIATSGAVTITGGVYTGPAMSVSLGPGPSIIRSSRCALEPVSRAASGLRIVPLRGWWH